MGAGAGEQKPRPPVSRSAGWGGSQNIARKTAHVTDGVVPPRQVTDGVVSTRQVTNETFRRIAASGLNTVRVPFGYWIFGDQVKVK